MFDLDTNYKGKKTSISKFSKLNMATKHEGYDKISSNGISYDEIIYAESNFYCLFDLSQIKYYLLHNFYKNNLFVYKNILHFI